jgi:xanthosine utilization system XapX-like protein
MKDKKQVTQVVILVALVAVFVGYGIVKFAGSKPKAAQTPATTATKQAGVASQGQSADGAANESATDTASQASVVEQPCAVEAVVTTDNTRDPFAPSMVAASNFHIPPAPRIWKTASRRTDPPVIPNVGLLPMGVGPSQSVEPGPTAVDQAKPATAPVPFPEFVLTGVITGRENVGIIRLGESRYIVKEGQRIDGIYRVVSVSQEGVLVTRDSRSVFLKLGGEGNASKN